MTETAIAIQDNTPMGLIRLAMEKQIDMDKLTGLFALQERYERNEAAKEYAAAISGFQADCPPIAKERNVMNKGGQSVRFKFAAWEDIAPVVNPILAKYRIACSFDVPESVNPGAFTMRLRVQVGTHVEVFPFTAPYPDIKDIAASTFCTEQQAVGNVNSYFKRYHFINVFNITIVGEDNEALMGLGAGDTIGEKEAQQIRTALAANGKVEEAFLKWVQTFQQTATTVELIAAIHFDKIMDTINRGPKKGK